MQNSLNAPQGGTSLDSRTVLELGIIEKTWPHAELPFGFLVCDGSSILACQIRRPFLAALGVTEADHTKLDESFRLLIAHLAGKHRPELSDIESAKAFLSGRFGLRLVSGKEASMTHADAPRWTHASKENLVASFMDCYRRRSSESPELVEMYKRNGSIVATHITSRQG